MLCLKAILKQQDYNQVKRRCCTWQSGSGKPVEGMDVSLKPAHCADIMEMGDRTHKATSGLFPSLNTSNDIRLQPEWIDLVSGKCIHD